jgi:chromosome segregation ATPase
MANIRTFTDQEVLDAAKQLQDENKQVTANALRRIIGKGRPNTLFETYTELLAKGQAAQAATEVDNVVVMSSYDLPTELAENLEQAKTNLEDVFKAAYDMAMHTVETRLNRAMQEAKDAKIQAEELVEQAEINESKAYDEAEAERVGREEVEEVLQASQHEVEALRKEVQALTTACAEHKSTIEDLNGNLKAITGERDTTKAKNDDLERDLAVVRSDLENAQTDVREKKGELSTLHNDLRAKDQENGKLTAQNEALTEQLAAVRDEVEQLKKPKPTRNRKTTAAKNQDSASTEQDK